MQIFRICISLLSLSLAFVEGRHVGYHRESASTALEQNIATKINKRAVSMQLRGVNALRKLLTDCTPVKGSNVYRRYEKPGDFETALKEFYSVKPSNVKERKNNFRVRAQAGRVITGNVGNRRLVLKSHDVDGRPSLEVIETKFEPGPYIDQIVFKD